MNDELKPTGACPHCGNLHGSYRNVRASGWCQEYFDENGVLQEMNTENLNFSRSNTYACQSCNNIWNTRVEGKPNE